MFTNGLLSSHKMRSVCSQCRRREPITQLLDVFNGDYSVALCTKVACTIRKNRVLIPHEKLEKKKNLWSPPSWELEKINLLSQNIKRRRVRKTDALAVFRCAFPRSFGSRQSNFTTFYHCNPIKSLIRCYSSWIRKVQQFAWKLGKLTSFTPFGT